MFRLLLGNVQIFNIFPLFDRLVINDRRVVSIFEKQNLLNLLVSFILVQNLLSD